jgi:hypothetical protein
MARDDTEPDAGTAAVDGNGHRRARTTTRDIGDLPDLKSSQGRDDWSTWPVYEAAAVGLPGSWWYPVTWSREIGSKPVGIEVLGRHIMFLREDGRVRALHDRCPHRGGPLTRAARGPGRWARAGLRARAGHHEASKRRGREAGRVTR